MGIVETTLIETSYPRLVADIGGSNARFGYVPHIGEKVQYVRTLAVQGHATAAGAAQSYLGALKQEMQGAYRAPRHAAFAVATAVTSDQIDLTNSNWRFSCRALEAELELEQLFVLNDFEALAMSLPHLEPSQLRVLHSSGLAPRGTLAVIGPGTGLGVAGVVQTNQGWVVLPTEGGHVTLSAADDYEAALLAVARRSWPHVSAERLLSGIGLPVLHQAVATVLGKPFTALLAEQIVELGMAQTDEACSATIDAFCGFFGSFAGNVALTLGARGGIYIGGGIVPRFGERFFKSQFRARFINKGRFSDYLADVPCALITDTLVALTGAAIAIDERRK
jgi:glucokinase